MLCQALSTLVISTAFGLAICWQMSLVALVFVPLIAYSANATAAVLGQQTSKEKDSNVTAARLSTEALYNIRTIRSLHKESFFERLYSCTLDVNVK